MVEGVMHAIHLLTKLEYCPPGLIPVTMVLVHATVWAAVSLPARAVTISVSQTTWHSKKEVNGDHSGLDKEDLVRTAMEAGVLS